MNAQKEAALKVVRRLRASGYEAKLVGGCVRDEQLALLWGNVSHPTRRDLKVSEPHDYDVATDATPDLVEALFGRTVLVGKSFGVVNVVDDELLFDDARVITQVATFRADGNYADGRRPDEVRLVREFRDDVTRRDFTINGLAQEEDGAVTDLVGGLADLRAGIIRAIGDPEKRIDEDKLRMLRAVRFAARFGFQIEPGLMQAIRKHAPEIKACSGERICDELRKIFTHSSLIVAFDLLIETGLMEQVLPEVTAMGKRGGEQSGPWHPEGNSLVHTRMVLAQAAGHSFVLVLATLLHDIGKVRTQKVKFGKFWGPILNFVLGRFVPRFRLRISNPGHAEVGAAMAQVICRDRLKMCRAETDAVVHIVAQHMRMHDMAAPGVKDSTLAKLFADPLFPELRLLQHWDSFGNGQSMEAHLRFSHWHFFGAKLHELSQRRAHQRPGANKIVTGKTLVGMQLKPGTVFSLVLDAAYAAQLENEFVDEAGGIDWVRARLPEFYAAAAECDRRRQAVKREHKDKGSKRPQSVR